MLEKCAFLVLSALFVIVVGCKTIPENKGVTDNNIYYSEYDPSIQIKINKGFMYERVKGPNKLKHRFIKSEDGIRSVHIGLIKVNKSKRVDYFYPITFLWEDRPNVLETGTLTVVGIKWDYCDFVYNNTSNDQETCFLHRELAIWTPKQNIFIIRYGQKLGTSNCSSRGGKLHGEFRTAYDRMVKQFSEDIEMSAFDPSILGEPKNAAVVKPQNGEQSILEKKLRDLKQLYEEGLITQEEYDKKKSELLSDY